MDAGVLQLRVMPHDADGQQPSLLKPGETISPTLKRDGNVARTGPISLIIPTFYNASLKQRSLHNLLQGITRSQAIRELILVLSGGGEPEVADVEIVAADLPVRFVTCPPNERAKTRNLGTEAAANDYLMFLDDDMLLTDWRMVDVIMSEMLHQDADCALFPRRQYLRFPRLFDQAEVAQVVDAWRDCSPSIPQETIYDPVAHGCSFKTMAFCFPGCLR